MSKKECIQGFSDYIFWDVDRSSIDLFFLLKHHSLQELLDLYLQKYPDGSLFIALKSLSYFEDAEADPMPLMFEETDWADVKATIREAIASL